MTREMLCAAMPKSVEPHGLVLRGNSALGALLSSYLKSLIQQLDHVCIGNGPAIANATAHMIAACFHQTAETSAQAQTAIDLLMLDQHKQFVAKNLRDPALGPDLLCAMSGLSRTKLYRLFESVGGIANYIREQRLIRTFRDLRNPANHHRRVSEIAADWGFTSESHFSGVFRRYFGMTPGEARSGIEEQKMGLRQVGVPGSSSGAFGEWIERLR
jgi:AraC-like DNA-binding protein